MFPKQRREARVKQRQDAGVEQVGLFLGLKCFRVRLARLRAPLTTGEPCEERSLLLGSGPDVFQGFVGGGKGLRRLHPDPGEGQKRPGRLHKTSSWCSTDRTTSTAADPASRKAINSDFTPCVLAQAQSLNVVGRLLCPAGSVPQPKTRTRPPNFKYNARSQYPRWCLSHSSRCASPTFRSEKFKISGTACPSTFKAVAMPSRCSMAYRRRWRIIFVIRFACIAPSTGQRPKVIPPPPSPR